MRKFDDWKMDLKNAWRLLTNDSHGWRTEAWIIATTSFVLGAVIF